MKTISANKRKIRRNTEVTIIILIVQLQFIIINLTLTVFTVILFQVVSYSLPLQELADRVYSEHYKQIEHVTTDCVMSYSQFEEHCKRVVSGASVKSYCALELQLLEDRKICRTVTGENGEVRYIQYSFI